MSNSKPNADKFAIRRNQQRHVLTWLAVSVCVAAMWAFSVLAAIQTMVAKSAGKPLPFRGSENDMILVACVMTAIVIFVLFKTLTEIMNTVILVLRTADKAGIETASTTAP